MSVYEDKRNGKSYFQFQHKGKTYKGYPVTGTNKDAKKAEACCKAALLQGRWDLVEGKGEKTFSDVVDEFLKTYPNYWATKNKIKRLKEHFGQYKIRDINATIIDEYKTSMESEKSERGEVFSGGTINRDLSIISRIFSYAVEKEYITKNPASHKKVKRCTESDEIVRYLTEGEENALIEAITTEYHYMKPIILTLLFTGMRWGELTKLKWKENIDLRNGYITLSRTQTKGKKQRVIPMHPVLIEIFKELHKDRVIGVDLVFHNPKTYKPLNNVRKAWITLKKRSGIDLDFRIHDLRHSFACKILDKGGNVGIIRELLGHSSLAVTQKYTHAKKESVKAVINLL